MGILTDLRKGMRAELTAGAVMAASFMGAAGCSSSNRSDPSAGVAVDSRITATGGITLSGLTMPSIKGNRIELQLEDRQFSIIDLSSTRSYLVNVPPGTFVELRNATTRVSAFRSSRNETNESFVFSLPDNDLRHYELKTKSHRFCDQRRTDDSINDGTYIILLDTAKNQEVVSAIRIPSYGRLTGEYGEMNGIFHFKTPDGTLHAVKPPTQTFAGDAHLNPSDIQFIQSKIHPTQSGDALMAK